MKHTGIITGTVPLHGEGIFADLHKESVETEFGTAVVFCSGNLVFIARHGTEPSSHILPHRINHQANFAAMKKMGVDGVVGVNSTGGLTPRMKPGCLVIPDDYIQLGPGPTAVIGEPVHIAPQLDGEIRQELLSAACRCDLAPIDGGIYWQSCGPRLETRAEIRMIAQFADIIGMTMASEAIIAQELGIKYASLCSIDNFAHGLEDRNLTLEAIIRQAGLSAEAIQRILTCYVGR
jgi:5'-methylthioadenosine phosphorylase